MSKVLNESGNDQDYEEELNTFANNPEEEPLIIQDRLESGMASENPRRVRLEGQQNVSSFKPQPKKTAKQPMRTTKTSQKLVVFPESVSNQEQQKVIDASSEYGDAPEAMEQDDYDGDYLSHKIVEYPYSVAKEKEAERLKKLDKAILPRVTAYCTAKAYNMDSLFSFLVSKSDVNLTDPQRIDECIYTSYTPTANSYYVNYQPKKMFAYKPASSSPLAAGSRMLPKLSEESDENEQTPERGEIFFLDYGVTVFWGLKERDEQTVLALLDQMKISEDKLDRDEVETEAFHYQYRAFSQPRIFNDVIILRKPIKGMESSPSDHMLKLTISHAIAQSTKLTLYEGKIDDTITNTQHIPLIMAQTGKVPMSRLAIIKKIGHLFVMRINVNLVSPILDTPEIFWSEPSLEPLYQVVRGYLEISQRVELLNQRCAVVSDLLDMLKEHLNSTHGEYLEWIIIILICIEIIIGLVTILFEFYGLYRGSH